MKNRLNNLICTYRIFGVSIGQIYLFKIIKHNVFGLVSHVSLCGDEISQFISHLTEYYIRKKIKNNVVFKGI